MSHPDPKAPDRSDREHGVQSNKFKSAKSKAITKVKGFGSEYSRKGIKKIIKKDREWRIKHF